MYLKFSLLAALTGVAVAIPSRRSPFVLHEERATEPFDWVGVGRLESEKILPMRFGLTQGNLSRVEDMLMAVSHPESPTYGKYYTPADIVEIFSPSNETISSVTRWLIDSGFAKSRLRLSANKGWLSVDATTSEVEKLLNAEYYVYNHTSGEKQFGCQNYSVPAHVREHVDLIRPTVQFNHRPSPRAGGLGVSNGRNGPKASVEANSNTTPPSLDNCDQVITLDCLRALYAINYTPVATDKNSYGIVEYSPQAYVPKDFDLFFRNFSPSLVGVRPNVVLVDGAIVQTTTQNFYLNAESNLDLQYAMGLTQPQTITLLQTGAEDNWFDAVGGSFCTFEGLASCGIMPPPFVVSISYVMDEAIVTPAFANRQCIEYAKLGMLGTSVLHSTGDHGVAGPSSGLCLSASGQATSNSRIFNPGFPVSCPFITAVGATQVNPGSSVTDPEGACEQVIFSGGGFSNIFPLPSYQASAVTNFLTQHAPPFTSAQFNNSGISRAFPDLSANGANYVVGLDGAFQFVFGTSASSPVVGSMITLINDARLAAGKGPVGFLNPSIYSSNFTSGFNDITSGGNPGCGTPGFNATTGWDPVTGLGTPNLSKLLPLFLALP